ncbi:peptidoglycan-binding protein [Christensenellaceae bacterium NSJ-44]|uniref:Peptidoglycan-binding protein n=1 Tax=Luoshenia tenuis TaxID=2763654 RepID=A0A926HND7_9FIRM|nr:peptidoglycan-binding protein [Luoshenia tenuis]MBC8529550.1 peptidoglycan-binding protein [Luoshenia tenuis]
MQTIKRGSKGEAVRKMQRLLIAAGYSLPKYGADGTFGAESESALREFQSDNGLSADGICGPKTWAALQAKGAGETIRRGSKGEAVREMQQLLIAAGYALPKYGADGSFGAESEEALRKFQEANGLAVDGICGPKTWAALQAGDEPGTEHFKLREFGCRDGSAVPREYWGNVRALMAELEKIRAVWGKPIIINSGYRTKTYNQQCGGAKASQHLTANAVDISVQGVAPSTVYNKLNAMYPDQGLGKYAGFTHLDLRGYRARW